MSKVIIGKDIKPRMSKLERRIEELCSSGDYWGPGGALNMSEHLATHMGIFLIYQSNVLDRASQNALTRAKNAWFLGKLPWLIRSRRTLKKAVAISDRLVDAFYKDNVRPDELETRARILRHAGRLEESIQCAMRGLMMNPSLDAKTLLEINLGKVYKKQNKGKLAADHLLSVKREVQDMKVSTQVVYNRTMAEFYSPYHPELASNYARKAYNLACEFKMRDQIMKIETLNIVF